MVKIFKSGSFVRIKVYKGKFKPKDFRYDDIGSFGHIKRIDAQLASGKWITYGYLVTPRDIQQRREKTMKLLRRLKITNKQLASLNL